MAVPANLDMPPQNAKGVIPTATETQEYRNESPPSRGNCSILRTPPSQGQAAQARLLCIASSSENLGISKKAGRNGMLLC